MISIVLPVYNEEIVLKEHCLKVFEYLEKNLNDDYMIIISDNASTDSTALIGKELANRYEKIKYYRVEEKGKGNGVIKAWQNFISDIYIYMDIDLSTDIKHIPELIDGIKEGKDIAIGSRRVKGAKLERSIFRKFFSNSLKLILRLLFQMKVKDAPCGFKAVNKKMIDEILPQVKNRTWFFDTEMLILAEKENFKIKEIPVVWTETLNQKRQSKVSVLKVSRDYILNIFDLWKRIKK